MLGRSNFRFVFLFTPSELLSCASALRFHLAGFFLRFTARHLDELFRSLAQVGIRHTGLGTLFHGFMSSLVVQPFRTLQSKISKRFEVFFLFQKPSCTFAGWSWRLWSWICLLNSKAPFGRILWVPYHHFQKKYHSRIDQRLPSVLATTPISPHPSLAQCRCHGCNQSDHQGVLVWKPSKTRH